MAPCRNASQAVTLQQSLPYQQKSTHRGTPQSHGSLPNGTQGKCPEWRDNNARYLTIPDWGSVNLITGLAYIPIQFDPDLAFWPV